MKFARAFTLIEVLILASLIAILAAIALPDFIKARTRSKVSQVKSEMRTLAAAIEAYRADNGACPIPSFGHSTDGDDDSTFEVTNDAMSLLSMTDNRGVTTPVAYIAVMPRDVFSVKGRQWFGYVGWKDRWILTSYGPDQDCPPTWNGGDIQEVNDFPETNFDPQVLSLKAYDPTNGMVSDGDIYRTSLPGGS